MSEPLYYEQPQGGFTIDVNTETHRIQGFVDHCPNEDAAKALVYGRTPGFLGQAPRILIRRSVNCDRQGPAAWYITIEYGPGDPAEAVGGQGTAPLPPEPPGLSPQSGLGPEWSIDTSAQTAHITQALATKYRRVPADNGTEAAFIGSGPDEFRAIGLTKDRVEGCDILAPSLTVGLTVSRFSVSLAYINSALYGLVGRVNAKPFYIFDAGEVLYLGCSGNHTEDGRWRLSHKFACSPNEKRLKFGSGGSTVDPKVIEIPEKGGWQYVWVSYKWEEVRFGNDQILMQVPAVVYVQDVYKSGDFDLLDVGGWHREVADGGGGDWAPVGRGNQAVPGNGGTIIGGGHIIDPGTFNW